MAAVLYGRGRYARAYAVEGTARLIELALIVVAVIGFGAHQLAVAAILCAVAAADLATISLMKASEVDWARPNLRSFDFRWIATQFRPGLGFMLSNLTTQSVLLQGPRVALGIVSGGQAVAIYSVYATALRLVDQIVQASKIQGPRRSSTADAARNASHANWVPMMMSWYARSSSLRS